MRRIRSRSLASLTAALLALAFATPLRWLWARADAPWWLVYVLWASVVCASWLLERTQRRAEPPEPTEARAGAREPYDFEARSGAREPKDEERER